MPLMPQLSSTFSTFKDFCAKAWALARPYFESGDKWKARGLLLAIVALNLGAVYMLVLLNDWNRVFYDALQNKDQPVFWEQLGRFTYLAFAFIIIAVYRFYPIFLSYPSPQALSPGFGLGPQANIRSTM